MKDISIPKNKIDRILIVQTAFLGDVILTIPLIKKTALLFPEAKIDFLTIPPSRNLVETLPYIHQVLIYDKHGTEKGTFSLLNWQRRLREKKYQLALVPHRSLRSVLLVWGARIPIRIGFNKSAGRWLFTHVISYPEKIHEINRNLHLLTPFGQKPQERIKPEIYFTEADREVVEKWLSAVNLPSDKKFISLAPGSVWATKRWLPERYGELATQLHQKGFEIILIGGEKDRSIGNRVKKASTCQLYDAIGKFTLRQSALLIKKSRLLVTNDSAPLHMGVAVGTPVLAIFGPTIPEFGFYPYGETDRVVQVEGLSCRPCSIHGGMVCPISTFDCMKNITVEKVLTTALEMLNENYQN